MKLVFILILSSLSLFWAEAKPGRTDCWKHGLKGSVQSCRTLCYRYDQAYSGTRTLQRSLLEYAGSAYDVDSYFLYDSKGFIVEEKTQPFDEGLQVEKRVYDRDTAARIIQVRVYIGGTGIRKPEKLKYEYNAKGNLVRIDRYDAKNQFVETVERYRYDNAGNRIMEWVEDEMKYRFVMNCDDKCVEEAAFLPDGSELYHNYHQYDRESGRRLKSTFTANKKIIEVRDNPYSDNILDDGEILTTDAFGNWITMLFETDEESGSIVVREITYYP